jgi:hypothetical protein
MHLARKPRFCKREIWRRYRMEIRLNNSGQSMRAPQHSVLHNPKISLCTIPWEKLRGDDDVSRTCPKCESQIFKVKGLEESEVESLVRSSWLYSDATPKVFFRRDGTVIVENLQCDESGVRLFLMSTGIQLGGLVLTWGTFCIAAFFIGLIGILIGLLKRDRKLVRFAALSLVLPPLFLAVIIAVLGYMMVLISGR